MSLHMFTAGDMWLRLKKLILQNGVFVVRPSPYLGYHVDYNPLRDWKDYKKYKFPEAKDTLSWIERHFKKRRKKTPEEFKNKYFMGRLTARALSHLGNVKRGRKFLYGLASGKGKNWRII